MTMSLNQQINEPYKIHYFNLKFWQMLILNTGVLNNFLLIIVLLFYFGNGKVSKSPRNNANCNSLFKSTVERGKSNFNFDILLKV
ncbi:MAG: hypothetical protein K0R36_3245 [Chryseobacterium sp.]|nr:hypothetical protein [Chryseobacterium sp.]